MKNFSLVLLLLLALTACSGPAQPTETPVPTRVRTATPTLAPTGTPLLPTETMSVASEWGGIPIMPGATTGDGDEEGFVFTVKATPQQVQQFYELELDKLGWQLSARGVEGVSLMLMFENDTSATLTVNIITKGDDTLVLLAK